MATPVYKLSDKRKQQRFSIALPSEIELNGANSPALSLVSRDVCAGGGFYLTDKPLPIGSQVKIRMLLKLGDPDRRGVAGSQISVSGTVIRTEADGVAVSFDKKYKIIALRK
ncbi:MAG: PilZ domain-containing protein [Desulfobacterales bacterium]